MPVFELPEFYDFPDPSLSEPDGLLAVGGDLSTGRLIKAYENAIFPWYNEPPILWFSPDPRFVIFPQKFRVSRSLQKVIRQSIFTVTYNTKFSEVMRACATVPRKEENHDLLDTEELVNSSDLSTNLDIGDIADSNNKADSDDITKHDLYDNHVDQANPVNHDVNDDDETGTWITDDMLQAYHHLHKIGRAHSVEVWKEGKLCGGLYGVTVGKFFCGESMFYKEPNASKVALVYLIRKMQEQGFTLLDTQMHTAHLAKFGAEFISRDQYLSLLWPGLQEGTLEFPGV